MRVRPPVPPHPKASPGRPGFPAIPRSPGLAQSGARRTSARAHRGFGLPGLLGAVAVTIAAIGLSALLMLALAALLANERLPPLDVLTDYRPKLPLRVYTADGELIGEFGCFLREGPLSLAAFQASVFAILVSS